MRRVEMVKRIADLLGKLPPNREDAAELVLSSLERDGMAPPTLPSAYSQAITQIYIYPRYNQWEEQIEKDEKVINWIKNRRGRK